jgi:hypothetical protein
MDTLQFSGTPEEYLIDHGIYQCLSCVPQVDVRADGSDHKIAGHEAYYDTIAARILDGKSVELAFKKNGKPSAVSTDTVSSDGQTMIEEFSNNMQGETVTGKAAFIRVGKGPSVSHPLSGQWQMLTIKNYTRAGTLTTYQTTTNGMKISDGSESYEAKFDGKDHPVNGDSHSTVLHELVDENTMEETEKRDGKIVSVTLMTLSKDGKSMKVEVADKQRGQTMTYTAEKIP